MNEVIVYHIMHTERCVAQVSTAGECKIYFEDFMPYGLMFMLMMREIGERALCG